MLGFSPIGSVPLADFSLIQSQARVQLNFPPDPSIGDVYTKGSAQYIFTGTKWKLFGKKYNYKGAVPDILSVTQIDLSAGNFFDIILNQQTTFSFANPPTSSFAKKFQVKLSVVSDYTNRYDLANASYDNVSFSVAGLETVSQDLFFKPDGTKMYVIGQSTDNVNEYNLSTAWDISTASYLQNYNTTSGEGQPTGIFFKSDGTKMYIIGTNNDSVREYNLGTGWDVSTASYIQTFSVADQDTVPHDLFFKPDGTKMFILGSTGNDVNEYELSTAWDISTATYSQSFSVADQETFPRAMFINSDGFKMFILGSTGDDVNEYELSTAWDISTASYIQTFSVASQDILPTGLFFDADGFKMYVLGDTNDTVYQYTVGGPSTTTPTVTWPNSILWETGFAPTLPDLGQTDILEFYTSNGGSLYYGKLKEDNVS